MCGIYFLKFSGAPSDAEMLGNWGLKLHLAILPAVVEEMLHRCKLLAALPAFGLVLRPDNISIKGIFQCFKFLEFFLSSYIYYQVVI